MKDTGLYSIDGRKILREETEEENDAINEELPPIDESNPLDAMFKKEYYASMKLMQILQKKVLSRGDHKEALEAVAIILSAQHTLLSVLMKDFQMFYDQIEQNRKNTYAIGGNLAGIQKLLVDKGVFTREELEMSKEQIQSEITKMREEHLKKQREDMEFEVAKNLEPSDAEEDQDIPEPPLL